MDFQNLWNKHPTIVDDSVPCSTDGKANFSISAQFVWVLLLLL